MPLLSTRFCTNKKKVFKQKNFHFLGGSFFKDFNLVGFGILVLFKAAFLRIIFFQRLRNFGGKTKKKKLTDIGFLDFYGLLDFRFSGLVFSRDLDNDQCLFEHQSTSECKYISGVKTAQAHYC